LDDGPDDTNEEESMPKVIGYGEDGLTYWALNHRLEEVLALLGDDSDPDKCLVFFRPSFGRAGGVGSPQFGEFDAILLSEIRIYPIESKWDGSRVVVGGQVVLDLVQILRHQILLWILSRWLEQSPVNWSAFLEENEPAFHAAFGGKPLPPARSQLACNLEHILNILASGPIKPVENVLLFLHREGGAVPVGIARPPEGFTMGFDFNLVPVPYEALGDSLYFEVF
jgi:hypothetical protein